MVSPAPRTARTPSRRRSSYLHQQLVPRDPLHGLDHQVGQSLLLLVLPHALLQKQAKKKKISGDKDGPVRRTHAVTPALDLQQQHFGVLGTPFDTLRSDAGSPHTTLPTTKEAGKIPVWPWITSLIPITLTLLHQWPPHPPPGT